MVMRLLCFVALLSAVTTYAAPVCSLQRGIAVMNQLTVDAGASPVQTMSWPLSPPLDPSRSMLFFGVRVTGGDISFMQVKGTLFADRVEFERGDSDSQQPNVVWTVVEFCGGVTVIRADEPVDSTTLIPVSAFDPTKTFVTASARAPANDYDPNADNFLLAFPQDGTTLRVQHGALGGRNASWQRFTDNGMRVIRGSLTLLDGVTTLDVPVTVPANAFARVTWRGLRGLNQDMLVSASLVPGAVRVTRGQGGGAVDTEWEVVSFTDGTFVQTGSVTVPVGSTRVSVTLQHPVDLSRSVSFLAGHETFGVSMRSYDGASATTQLTVPATLEIEHDSADGELFADYVVLEFPLPDGGTTSGPDGGLSAPDAGTGMPDAGAAMVDAGSPPALEILSQPTTTASCNLPWKYLPSAQGPGSVTWTLRAVGDSLPGGLFVNTESGEVLFRPTRAGSASFELVAHSGGQSVSQQVSIDVTCERVGVGGSCSSAPEVLFVLAALLVRRRRDATHVV